MKTKILFTGFQPTGVLSLGQYLGVIKKILASEEAHQIIIMIADLHSTSLAKKGFNYQKQSYEMASLLYACGFDEKKTKIFIQSQIPQHLELFFLLSSQITVGRLSNMIQYKEKKREEETGSLTLLSYPVLMASDILLYDSDVVIVGQDQSQHLELTKELIEKFNRFVELPLLKKPNFLIPALGARIMSLEDANKKMSKSEGNFISLLDKPELVEKKVMAALTDSENLIYYDPVNKPGISNLILIYSLLEKKNLEESEKELAGLNYGQFKKRLIKIINDDFKHIQERFESIKPKIEEIIKRNKIFIGQKAKRKIKEIKKSFYI